MPQKKWPKNPSPKHMIRRLEDPEAFLVTKSFVLRPNIIRRFLQYIGSFVPRRGIMLSHYRVSPGIPLEKGDVLKVTTKIEAVPNWKIKGNLTAWDKLWKKEK